MPALLEDVLGERERSARRAVYGWLYEHGHRGTVILLRSAGESSGWSIRRVTPRRPYARSDASRGNRSRYAHRVREQIVATRGSTEYRMTRYWCGASTWAAALSWVPVGPVCRRCEFTLAERERNR